jgi:hypothetical protein
MTANRKKRFGDSSPNGYHRKKQSQYTPLPTKTPNLYAVKI